MSVEIDSKDKEDSEVGRGEEEWWEQVIAAGSLSLAQLPLAISRDLLGVFKAAQSLETASPCGWHRGEVGPR